MAGRWGRGWCTSHGVVVVLAVLFLGSAASAQRRSVDPEQAAKDKEAREHYNKGILHYDLGEIDTAIAEFKQAYAISAAPGLLFNIAQAYRFKKDYEQALHFYQTYLRLSPRAINRRDVEERVAELEKLVAEGQHAQSGRPHGVLPPGDKTGAEQPGEPAPPTTTAPTTTAPTASTPTTTTPTTTTPTAPPTQPSPEAGRVAETRAPAATAPATASPAVDRSFGAFLHTPAGKATIAVGALGVGALIGGAAMGGVVLSQRSTYNSGCDGGRCDDALYQRTHGLAVGTDVMIAVGAVAVATSVVLLIVRPGMRGQPRHAAAASGLAVTF